MMIGAPDKNCQETKEMEFILEVVKMQNLANEQMNSLMNRL